MVSVAEGVYFVLCERERDETGGLAGVGGKGKELLVGGAVDDDAAVVMPCVDGNAAIAATIIVPVEDGSDGSMDEVAVDALFSHVAPAVHAGSMLLLSMGDDGAVWNEPTLLTADNAAWFIGGGRGILSDDDTRGGPSGFGLGVRGPSTIVVPT